MGLIKTSIVAHALVMTLLGCSGESIDDNKSASSDAPTESEKTPTASTVETSTVPTCTTPIGAPAQLTTIEDVVQLVNLLPMPVSQVCFIEAIPRPLKFAATASILSVQPANGSASPRIFLFSDSLVMTFNSSGTDHDSNTIELSILSGSSSVKAELPFPVTAPTTAAALYQSVARKDGQLGTRCSACHQNEVQAPAPYPTGAFLSDIMEPAKGNDVPLEYVKKQVAGCAQQQDERCRRLRAVLVNDQLVPKVFSK